MSEPLRVLVTGASGQVGTHLVRTMRATHVDGVAMSRADLDITDFGAVRRAFDTHRPDAVVNTAAFTAVDRAEAEADAAFAVNRDGAEAVARACAESGAALVHLSTDYVFDGAKDAPYVEGDPVSPINVYGASKAAGEAAVRSVLDRHVILRTAWVFSAQPPNFVQTIMRLARERDTLQVVADQHGHPTWAGDVATAALTMAGRLVEDASVAGTVHYAGGPLTTWHGLAQATVEAAIEAGMAPAPRVEPVPTSAFPRPARRPARVELDLSRVEQVFNLFPPDWKRPLGEVVRRSVRVTPD